MEPRGMNIFLASPEEMEALGSRLVVEPSTPWKTLALHGELGAGKTTLVRGLVRAMGGDPDEVHSPSYLLEHHYEVSGGVLVHRDAWRGDAGESHGVMPECCRMVVEWPDKANREMWPHPVLALTLKHTANGRVASVPDGIL